MNLKERRLNICCNQQQPQNGVSDLKSARFNLAHLPKLVMEPSDIPKPNNRVGATQYRKTRAWYHVIVCFLNISDFVIIIITIYLDLDCILIKHTNASSSFCTVCLREQQYVEN